MKKITTYIILVVVIFSLTDCKKVLEVKPQGAISEEDASSPESVEGLITATYAWIPNQETINDQLSFWIADVKADDSYKGGGGLSDGSGWYQNEIFTVVTPNVIYNDGIWYGLYQGVSRCNSALKALNKIDEAAFPLKTQRIAEMRFLRGYMFLLLKRWYKWIPYYDENVERDSIIKIPNHPDTAANDLYIWNNIYQDFSAAAANLPDRQDEVGRVNKYAAEAEMVNVLLWMAYEQDNNNHVVNINNERLTQALTYIDDIITNGGYSLTPDFGNNFQLSYDNATPESMFEWQYSRDDGTPNGNLNRGTPLNAPWWAPYFSCCDFHKASYSMVNAFRVDSNGLPLFDSFNDAVITDKNAYFAGNNWDPRIGHTVAIPGLPWKYQSDLLFDSTGSRDPATYGYFNSLKENVEAGSPGLVNLFWMYSSKNESVIRFDRVLLWKAEILIKLGRELEALPIINQIRERAANSMGMLKFSDGTPTLPYKIGLYEDGVNCTWTPDFAWEALVWENRLEFAMEGERWYDLVRWGVAESVLNTHFQQEIAKGRTWHKDAHFTAGRDEFMPIPQPQMNYSYGVYKQNVGY